MSGVTPFYSYSVAKKKYKIVRLCLVFESVYNGVDVGKGEKMQKWIFFFFFFRKTDTDRVKVIFRRVIAEEEERKRQKL